MSTMARMMILGTALPICLCSALASAADVAKGTVNDRDKKDNDRRGITERSTRSDSDNSRASSSGPSAANRDDARNRSSAPASGGRNPASNASSGPSAPSYQSRSSAPGWYDRDPRNSAWDRNRDRDYDDHDHPDYRDDRDGNYGYANPYVSPYMSRFFSGTGTLVGASSGVLQVNANGSIWRIKPIAGARIEVVGTAGPDFLRPGLFVKFQAPYDSNDNNNGKALVPVTALEIVTLQFGEMSGALPVDATKAAAAGAANNPPLPPTARTLVVIGQITRYKNKELTVIAGKRTLQAELDPAPTIKVHLSDVGLAHPGDQIDVDGYYLNKPGDAMANQVRITLAAPLGDPLSEFGKKHLAGKPAPKLAPARP